MYQFIKLLFQVIFLLSIRINLVRHDQKNTKGKILIANHVSTFDPIFVLMALKERVSILVTQNAFNVPIVGLLLKASNHIPVEDGNGRGAYEEALKRLKNKENILLFPEHWSNDSSDKKPKFYSGATRLAMETGTPVIPIGISFPKKNVIKKKLIIKNTVQYAKFYIFGRYNITLGKPVNIGKQEINKKSITINNEKLRKEIYKQVDESKSRLIK